LASTFARVLAIDNFEKIPAIFWPFQKMIRVQIGFCAAQLEFFTMQFEFFAGPLEFYAMQIAPFFVKPDR